MVKGSGADRACQVICKLLGSVGCTGGLWFEAACSARGSHLLNSLWGTRWHKISKASAFPLVYPGIEQAAVPVHKDLPQQPGAAFLLHFVTPKDSLQWQRVACPLEREWWLEVMAQSR